VEDLQTKLRDEKITKELQKSKMKGSEKTPGVSLGRNGNKKWQSRAVAAAGAGNEVGQIFLRRNSSSVPSLPTRFRANVDHQEENEENMKLSIITSIAKKLIGTLSRRHKIIIGIIVGGAWFLVMVWFLLGCYGLYFLIQQVSSNIAHQVPTYGGSQREIVLRIVQDSTVQKALNQQTIVAAAAKAIKEAAGGEL